MTIHLHDKSVLGAWKHKLLKTVNHKNVNLWKRRWRHADACYVFRLKVCVHACSVSIQIDIANYWTGMQNTAFLVIAADPCERGPFWQCCHLYAKLFKNKGQRNNFSIFCTWLSCKCPLAGNYWVKQKQKDIKCFVIWQCLFTLFHITIPYVYPHPQ